MDFVRQQILSLALSLNRVDTADNIADMSTKALVLDTFKKHRLKLNLRDADFGGNVEIQDLDAGL